MFTIENFEERWNNEFPEIVEYDSEIVDGLEISEESKNFLKKYGLPDEAPGYLIFKPFEDENTVSLASICDGKAEYEKYISLGCDGGGLPVCIEKNTGNICIIDIYENTEPVFINSSLIQLAESMVLYSEFINRIIEINGEDAYLDGDADDESLEWIRDSLEETDTSSLEDGTFWDLELSDFTEEE